MKRYITLIVMFLFMSIKVPVYASESSEELAVNTCAMDSLKTKAHRVMKEFKRWNTEGATSQERQRYISELIQNSFDPQVLARSVVGSQKWNQLSDSARQDYVESIKPFVAQPKFTKLLVHFPVFQEIQLQFIRKDDLRAAIRVRITIGEPARPSFAHYTWAVHCVSDLWKFYDFRNGANASLTDFIAGHLKSLDPSHPLHPSKIGN